MPSVTTRIERGVAFCDWAMVSALSGFIKMILAGTGNCLWRRKFRDKPQTMLADGFQLVNAERSAVNILG
jgi:hypothetical protein